MNLCKDSNSSLKTIEAVSFFIVLLFSRHKLISSVLESVLIVVFEAEIQFVNI